MATGAAIRTAVAFSKSCIQVVVVVEGKSRRANHLEGGGIESK